jgi:hypothetical protein
MRRTILSFLAFFGLVLCAVAQNFTTPGIIRETRGSHRYCGFIKQDGKVVVRPIYLNAHEFSEGLAAVQDTNKRWGFINTTGKKVFTLPTNVIEVGDFHEGLCWFRDDDSKKVGYIDRTGKVVIRPQWDYACDFNDGLAAVGEGRYMWEQMCQPGHMIGYIDHTGKVVIPVNLADRYGENHKSADFSCGRAILHDGDRVRIIDTKGKELFGGKYREAIIYSEGRCSVGVATNEPCNAEDDDSELPDCKIHWSVIDTAGNMVLNRSASAFREGVAYIRLSGGGIHLDENNTVTLTDGDYIFIDTTGKQIIERHFKAAYCFQEGLAYVTEMDGTKGFIDHAGKMVFKLPEGYTTYNSGGFKNGMVTIWERTTTNDGRTIYYDEEVRNREGKILWMDSYTVSFH